jgi:tetratricopeptide (TPR) repeat protein
MLLTFFSRKIDTKNVFLHAYLVYKCLKRTRNNLLKEIMRISNLYFIYVISICFLLFSSCSTENNTFINRNYHSITAKYNGYYNANDLMNTSLTTYRVNVKEDYYSLLPVEVFPTEKEVQGLLPAIDTAISKCTKVIRNHCMPSMDVSGGKKVEHNRWIDENWNTIGRAYFYRRDYDLSQKNFQFVQKLFAEDKSNYVASIWILKSLLETKKYREAKELISKLDKTIEELDAIALEKKKNKIATIKSKFSKNKDKEKERPTFTKKLKVEYYLTKGSYFIQKNDIHQAIQALETSIKFNRNKKSKTRTKFILGQLLTLVGNQEKAKECFSYVVKSSVAPFEMQFNARIKRAFLGKDLKVKKELTKMVKDEKNSEYRDQLYYALAELELQENNKRGAIILLHKSTFYSLTNKRQQAISYEKLGVLSYLDKDYVRAQKYFDSCANVMPENFPNEEDIRKKVNKLKKLVESIEVVEREDSLLRLAALDDKERDKFIERAIRVIKFDQEKKEREALAKLKAQQAQQLADEQNNPSANKWYWNNVKLKADGSSEFKKNWGSRENEDDWRRSDKIITQTKVDTAKTISASKEEKTEQEDTLTVAYLSKNIPLTQEAQDSSIARLLSASYDAGMIYKEQLYETSQAIRYFQDILDRKTSSSFNLLAAYQLYKIYDANGDPTKSKTYANYILVNYPESEYASFLKDPNYFIKKKENEKKLEENYLKLLGLYRANKFMEVVQGCTNFEKTCSASDPLRPKLLLLKAMAMAASKTVDNVSLVIELEKIVKEFPGGVEAGRASELLKTISTGISKPITPTKKKEFIYTYVENEPLWVILFLEKNVSSNLPKIKVGDFCNDMFEDKNYIVSSKLYEQDQSVVLIKELSHTDGETFISTFKSDTKFVSDFVGLPIYLISQENLKILFETKKVEEYREFYDANY